MAHVYHLLSIANQHYCACVTLLSGCLNSRNELPFRNVHAREREQAGSRQQQDAGKDVQAPIFPVVACHDRACDGVSYQTCKRYTSLGDC